MNLRADSPPGRFLAGHLTDFARDPLGFLTSAARDHGPATALRFGRTHALLLSDPGLIEDVLVKQRTSFIKARALRAQHRLFGNGLLTNEGEPWRAQRRLAQPAFHPRALTLYAQVMVRHAREFAEGLRDGEVRDIHSEMKRLLMIIIAECLFGDDVSARAAQIGTALESSMEMFASRRGLSRLIPESLPTATMRAYRRGVDDIEEFVNETVAKRAGARGAHRDLLAILLAARDESGQPMSGAQLRDEAITLFVGGFDTPALSLSWTWYLLSRHPEIADAVNAEVREVLGDRDATAEDVDRLRLTQRIVKESMRLYPPAWIIAREAAESVTLGHRAVPRGTTILMSQWVMHRDPRYFEAPDEFRPERWEAEKSSIPRFAYFPFGGGPRVCIGASFAMMEATLVLATLAQRVRFRMASDERVVPQASMTLRPRGGMMARVERR